MFAKVGPHRHYRASQVPWLGDIPNHWQLRRIKYLLRERDQRAGKEGGTLLSLSRHQGLLPHSQASKRIASVEDLSDYRSCRPGDLVMNRMQAWSGMFAASTYQGVVSPDYCVFEARIPLEMEFCAHLFRTPMLVSQFALRSKGIGSGFNRLYAEDFGEIPVPMPPRREQNAIIHFLAHADRLIRRYIAAKEKLIALLEEQKQALIHQAVTGKVDVRTGQPYPGYKSSGAEWLEVLPGHWRIKRLGQCGTVTGGMTPSMGTEGFWDGSIPWVTPKDMKQEAISGSEDKVAERALRETSLGLIDPPAVLMVVRGMILARRVPVAWTKVPVTINQDMKALCPEQGISPEFLVRWLDSAQDALFPMIDQAGHGTRRLPTERWRQLFVAIPPEEEQNLIVRSIESAAEMTDRTVNRSRRAIAVLRELHARLIADVVTGKLDVREAAAQLPEVDSLQREDDQDHLLGLGAEAEDGELGQDAELAEA